MVTPFNANKQWKQFAVTLLVGIIFFWFWSQGSLNKPAQLINLVENESAFLIPIFIQDNTEIPQKTFGLLSSKKTENTGVSPYKLVGQKNMTKSYGLIADPHHQPSMFAEVGEAIHQRAKLFNSSSTAILKSALDMFYIEQRNVEGKLSGLYIESTGLTEHIKGYAGAITLGISISPQGKINKVHYIASQETSSYLRQIENAGFYQQFSRVDLDGNAHQIDAVSGATISTQAMAKTVTELLNKAAESPLSLYMDEDTADTRVDALLTNEWIIQIVVITLIFSYFWQPWVTRSRSKTTAVMLFSALYIGFYLNNSFTYISLLHPFLGVTVSLLVGFYCALVLLGAIWNNNTYCKFVCPYGNVQRLITRMMPNLRQSFFVSSRWVKRVRTVLTLVVAIGVIIGKSQWASYELFPDLFGLEALSFWFYIALATILIASIYPMIWCRLLCPTGEVLDWLSDLVSAARIKNKPQPKKHSISCIKCTASECISNRIDNL
ncbi:MAG: FMN-binding protein [Methylococcales symbiont of Hymedesmia sp. n. MRB-2018]|nr:MAG: FMN-binding protein [Methylococcales symbiont of Hymedesmia sp. n. MRB-2018]